MNSVDILGNFIVFFALAIIFILVYNDMYEMNNE